MTDSKDDKATKAAHGDPAKAKALDADKLDKAPETKKPKQETHSTPAPKNAGAAGKVDIDSMTEDTDEAKAKREENKRRGRVDTIDVGDGVKRAVDESGHVSPPVPDDYDPLPPDPEPMQPAND